MIRQASVTVEPELVQGGDEALVLRRVFDLSVRGTLVRVGSFLGVDTGDIVECHAEVVHKDLGLRVYARSLHKETTTIYDAWDWKNLSPGYGKGPGLSTYQIHFLCRVTGRNWAVFTKRWNPLTAYFHGSVILETLEGEA